MSCADRLSTLILGVAAVLPANRSIDVCSVNAEDLEQAVALAVQCASTTIASYTRIALSSGSTERGIARSPEHSASARKRRLLKAIDEMHLGLVRHAFTRATNDTGRVPTLRVIRQDAPTTRGLTLGCDLLVLRMDGATADARNALRVDLAHTLRLGLGNRPIVAFAETPCTGPHARPIEKYTGAFAQFPEQCWQPQWAEFVASTSLLPLVSSWVNASWCSADGGVQEAAGDSSRSNRSNMVSVGSVGDFTGIGCIALSGANRALCRRRPPLLSSEHVTREPVLFTDSSATKLLRTSLRYFSAIPLGFEDTASSYLRDGAQRVALLFKNDVQERWVGGLASADGLTFHGAPRLVYPKHSRRWPRAALGVLTHNLAMAFSPRLGFMIVGGQHRNRALSGQPNKVNGYHKGIWAATGATWDYDPLTNLSDADIDDKGFPRRDRVETQWRGKRMVLRGSHPGCIERRDRTRLVWLMRDTCEFDGRLSLVPFNGSLLLFARANMANHGQRFVQVTRSRDDGRTWASFEPISIAGYEHTSGDVYFWAAQVNPVHAASLIATFPLVQHFSGCIGLSLSLDGIRWARVTPLLACDSVGERALAHPASPSMILQGDKVFVYVHESVPGASVDAFTPRELYLNWRESEEPGRVARYTLPVAVLERWTRRALRSLGVRPPDERGHEWA
jgi:hypothetical protein